MVQQKTAIEVPLLWLGAGILSGLVGFCIHYFRKHPEHSPTLRFRQKSLDQLLVSARQGEVIELKASSRYVLFSDHHMGLGERADNFRKCAQTYLSALDAYYSEGYILIEMGDVEELLENAAAPVLRANARIYESTRRFYPERYLRVTGNHDGAWKNPRNLRKYLERYYPGIQVRPQLLFTFEDETGNQGEILCIHGHQGTLDSDVLDFLPPLILPAYRIFQNLTGIGMTRPSEDIHKRGIQDNQMYTWSKRQKGLILIAGHTHRPIWSSLTHLERLVLQLHELKSQVPPPSDYATKFEQLQDAINHRAVVDPLDKDELVKLTPCYFNTGCCSFLDSDITGIEIADIEMRLVKWGAAGGKIGRKVLESSSLAQVFTALKS